MFVRIDANPMSYPMDKILPISGIGDNTACSTIDFLTRDPGTNGRLRGFVRGAVDIVNLNELRIRVTGYRGATGIRPIAVKRCGKVDHDGITALNHPV